MTKLTSDLGASRSAAPFARMTPGETRTHFCKDGSAITITRTNRPFIHDWIDAANARIEQDRPGYGYRWAVDHTGTPQLARHRALDGRASARSPYRED